MYRLILASLAAVTAIFTSSCGCCTSDAGVPPLRPLPIFQEVPAAPIYIEATK